MKRERTRAPYCDGCVLGSGCGCKVCRAQPWPRIRRRPRRRPPGRWAQPANRPLVRLQGTRARPLNVPGFAGTDICPNAQSHRHGHGDRGTPGAGRSERCRRRGGTHRCGGIVVAPPSRRCPPPSRAFNAPRRSRARRAIRTGSADGLASGSVRACGADLHDAGRPGRCGGVTYCVGARTASKSIRRRIRDS